MPFLSGRVSFDRFVVSGKAPRQFGEEQLRQLRKHAIAEGNTDSPEAPRVGFLAGRHLFDLEFEPAKNIIAETLHAAIRIDVSRVPAPLRKAWLEIELAALARGSETGRITRNMRQEAREAVQALGTHKGCCLTIGTGTHPRGGPGPGGPGRARSQ